jgi:hypothetical protein
MRMLACELFFAKWGAGLEAAAEYLLAKPVGNLVGRLSSYR